MRTICEKRNQNHCPHLHDTFLPARDDKERPLELEGNDDGEDCTEHSLEHRVLGRIERLGGNHAVEDLEREVPHGEDDDDGNQPREDKDDDLLELLS